MAQSLLDALEHPDSELSILIVDDPQIAGYNRSYLKREGPTNVIAFPMREGQFGDVNPQLLGDVVISVDTTRREAEEMGVSFIHRFKALLIHGVLHLLGYDHEASDEAALRMEAKSLELMQVVNR